MVPEIGHLALIIALLLALLLGTLALAGAQRSVAAWMAAARLLAVAQSGFVLLAWGCLVASFVRSDFSLRNVAENANSMLPLAYRAAAAWGSHEGSMLLWLTLQSLWMIAVARCTRTLPQAFVARVLGVLAWLQAGLILFVLTTSNPFLRLFPVAAEGRDLNPLLQDPGMVIHPPLLYLGYVGFSVSFAFAIAALLGRSDDNDWARWARPWTALAWSFLTLGVAAGSWWAYTELGWGGWWFWDPVENAALMPWLVGTALLHALTLADRRGVFGAWAVLLSIACFSLSLLGTFVVRSGVLSSVHAFAIDPRRGVFMLGLLGAVIGGALGLYAWRAGRIGGSAARFDAASRTSLLLANTLLLVVAAASVLLGTLYPIAAEVFTGSRISVGAPYFDAVFAPLLAPLVFLMGVAPLARWQRAALPELWTRLRWALVVAGLVGVLLPLVWGGWSAGTALGLFLAAWVALAIATAVWQPRPGAAARGLALRPLSWWGMTAAHLGVAVFVAGVTLVRSYQTETLLRMAPGASTEFAGQRLVFAGVAAAAGPNYSADRGSFELQRPGRPARTLHPEKRRYASLPAMPMTEAAIASAWTGDVYLSLGEPQGAGAWTVRAYHKPFVTWIWAGCALMALGGLLAACERRVSRVSRAARPAEANAALDLHQAGPDAPMHAGSP